MRHAKPSPPDWAAGKTAEYTALAEAIEAIRESLITLETSSLAATSGILPAQRESARNLLHYIALRRHDLRALQARLSQLGLSSLGRAEAHVLPNIDAILAVLDQLCGIERPDAKMDAAMPDFTSGQKLLQQHTEMLLGKCSPGRHVRIMVTMPSEAAGNYGLIRDFLARGMDCMRINCAHDDAGVWQAMILHLRQAEREVGRTCRVIMDLAGPKLRTGPVEPGPAVVRIRPKRDAYGRVIAPARVWLFDGTSGLAPPAQADACLPVSPNWLNRLSVGDRIRFVDTADRDRHLEVIKTDQHAAWAQSVNSAFVAPGTILQHHPARRQSPSPHETEVGDFSRQDGYLMLQRGDRLLLTPTLQPGVPAKLDKAGRVHHPATIGCTLPEAFEDVRIGDAIWLDDGKIGGEVEHNDAAGLTIRILHARPDGEKLRGDKGINLPDSELRLPAMTGRDRADLRFVVEHADLVAMSFANCPQDIADLIKEIDRIGNRRPGIIIKVETRRGFESLPGMLLEAMRTPACGVMIARGDLAVECGYQRLAEVQEEILWVCEAAHAPVIWATQVLENLARDGIPSRAEISDAALGNRAECVMLNKGTHILAAVETLDDILRRMQNHQDKKSSMMRKLKMANTFSFSCLTAQCNPGDDPSTHPVQLQDSQVALKKHPYSKKHPALNNSVTQGN